MATGQRHLREPLVGQFSIGTSTIQHPEGVRGMSSEDASREETTSIRKKTALTTALTVRDNL